MKNFTRKSKIYVSRQAETNTIAICIFQAGSAVDAFVERLAPLLETGDIIIDGGNSEYQDTERRVLELEKKGYNFNLSGFSSFVF